MKMIDLFLYVFFWFTGFTIGIWLDVKVKKRPKKPIYIEEFTEGGYIGKCPVCGSDCNDVMNYCDQCGQSLDWRNEE